MIKNYLLYILSIESRSYGVFPRRSHLKNRVFLIKTEQSTLEILQWTYHKYWKVFFIQSKDILEIKPGAVGIESQQTIHSDQHNG